jgi:Ion channel
MESFAVAVGLSVLLYVVTVLSHYEALRIISQYVDRSSMRPRARLLLVLFGTVLAHVFEFGLYALVFWYADSVIDIGNFSGFHGKEAVNYFYFSAETFTSLGMGDVYPRGALRLITSLEVLNGLTLIGWSTSFTFLAMSRLWDLHPRKSDV